MFRKYPDALHEIVIDAVAVLEMTDQRSSYYLRCSSAHGATTGRAQQTWGKYGEMRVYIGSLQSKAHH